MTPASDLERDVLKAIRTIYKRHGAVEVVLARSVISLEIMEHPREYPSLKKYNITERRKRISGVCDRHFQPFSNNWRSGAWIITPEVFA